jgi:hypothetical protein
MIIDVFACDLARATVEYIYVYTYIYICIYIYFTCQMQVAESSAIFSDTESKVMMRR